VRELHDAEGRRWEVVVGRESWGAFFAIFVPDREGLPFRQSLLRAASYEAAARELDELGREALLELFSESERKELG
jgi:hypothetical protein